MAATDDAVARSGGPVVTNDEGVFTLSWPSGRPREFLCTPEVLEQLVAERNRYREHSVLLNSVGWRIAEALGDVDPGDTTNDSAGVLVDLERLIAKVPT